MVGTLLCRFPPSACVHTQLGLRGSAADELAIFRQMDVNGSGSVRFDEFARAARKLTALASVGERMASRPASAQPAQRRQPAEAEGRPRSAGFAQHPFCPSADLSLAATQLRHEHKHAATSPSPRDSGPPEIWHVGI